MSRDINGATVLTAIFGDPVEHSKSPAMHNAAYAALAMNRAYVAFRVRRENFAAALRAIPALNIAGVNLTVPHKESAARLIRNLSAEARLLGAVNCVINRRGDLYGDNTDARGLERDLRELKSHLRGGLAIVIGAGGAAAAAVLACQRIGAREIAICNRTIARARALKKRMTRPRASAMLTFGLDALTDAELLPRARIVVNATPMGLTTPQFASLDYDATPTDCLFYDLIYAAQATPFLRPAIALKRRVADGAGMLINQGELAFKLFNRIAPPAGVMKAALLESLGRNHL
ncbi:MAG: shikimate dehydrogenase [Candidatus Binatus sp.]|uniref:shikimate dehydrogenase n=1 Tax=Candidatus Binatus sp. TaxID=2811406 RepID=UPI00272810E3|nr:shikimate dehydrogenase [Candidatus Binatus sp.]MDO8431555.1 shikimate dehydrogenase [Candidatus Binatus sp.]